MWACGEGTRSARHRRSSSLAKKGRGPGINRCGRRRRRMVRRGHAECAGCGPRVAWCCSLWSELRSSSRPQRCSSSGTVLPRWWAPDRRMRGDASPAVRLGGSEREPARGHLAHCRGLKWLGGDPVPVERSESHRPRLSGDYLPASRSHLSHKFRCKLIPRPWPQPPQRWPQPPQSPRPWPQPPQPWPQPPQLPQPPQSPQSPPRS